MISRQDEKGQGRNNNDTTTEKKVPHFSPKHGVAMYSRTFRAISIQGNGAVGKKDDRRDFCGVEAVVCSE